MNSKQREDIFPSCLHEKLLYCHLNPPQPFLYGQYLDHLRGIHNVPTFEGENGYLTLNIGQGTDKALQPHALGVFSAFSKEFLVLAVESDEEIWFYTVLLARPEKGFCFTSTINFSQPYPSQEAPEKPKFELSNSFDAEQLVKEFEDGMNLKDNLRGMNMEEQMKFFGPSKGGTDRVLSLLDSFYVMFELERFFSVEKSEAEKFAISDGVYKMWIQIEKVPNSVQTIQPRCDTDHFQPKKVEEEEILEWSVNEKGEYTLEIKINKPDPVPLTKNIVTEYEELLITDHNKAPDLLNIKFFQEVAEAERASSRFVSRFS